MKKIILATAIGIFLSTSVLAAHHEENTVVKPTKTVSYTHLTLPTKA